MLLKMCTATSYNMLGKQYHALDNCNVAARLATDRESHSMTHYAVVPGKQEASAPF